MLANKPQNRHIDTLTGHFPHLQSRIMTGDPSENVPRGSLVGIPENCMGYDTTTSRRKSMAITPTSGIAANQRAALQTI